jgi:hypothetical protein
MKFSLRSDEIFGMPPQMKLNPGGASKTKKASLSTCFRFEVS